ncbi:MAG TPA: hypothetical protein P5560_11210 [Thermotogota bacterium]|nr:hypothetical protein [Thermotogota bacterium]HRW93507.1 hypothetical protein [Thermotogota bacterium]
MNFFLWIRRFGVDLLCSRENRRARKVRVTVMSQKRLFRESLKMMKSFGRANRLEPDYFEQQYPEQYGLFLASISKESGFIVSGFEPGLRGNPVLRCKLENAGFNPDELLDLVPENQLNLEEGVLISLYPELGKYACKQEGLRDFCSFFISRGKQDRQILEDLLTFVGLEILKMEEGG